jgi:alkanesulfonate monooxygenase SsuD/methylene tetrahydromethanopterin reductase-like flavin-dependent oxidoreductase (luciferase family)
LEFGIFDHLDRSDLPLGAFYEERLRLIERYDRLGFYAYHMAEHHFTPLGMCPSPSVFMAAIAQRTKKLRFGPMVYALPLYHPLRMVEEVCMLDHMSGGRLEIGFGRGSSVGEQRYYGRDPAEAQAVHAEALELVLKGLTSKRLDFHGKYFNADDIPMQLEPLQRPHPPIWYGVHAPPSARRAATQGLRVISLDSCEDTAGCYQQFREGWREAQGAAPLPLMGVGRFVVVAKTDAEALALARPAYARWIASFTYLSREARYVLTHPRAPTWEGAVAEGRAIAGSPRTVTAEVLRHLEECGANYFVGQFAFGDIAPADAGASVERFAAEVMPAVRAARLSPVG